MISFYKNIINLFTFPHLAFSEELCSFNAASIDFHIRTFQITNVLPRYKKQVVSGLSDFLCCDTIHEAVPGTVSRTLFPTFLLAKKPSCYKKGRFPENQN